jgi:ketosteroid isomerase-like protein
MNTDLLYPDIADASHATPGFAAAMTRFFRAKSQSDVDATAACFAGNDIVYIDAIIGWEFGSWASLREAWAQVMPNWKKAGGRSYPVRVIGGDDGGVVLLHDTKELFGEELFGIAAVDLRGGQIERWVDYWDARQMSSGLRTAMLRPLPTDYRDDPTHAKAAGPIRKVALALQAAFATGDVEAAMQQFSTDVVVEDLALRTTILGPAGIRKYYEKALDVVPYGSGSVLAHIAGGTRGGSYEWAARPNSGFSRGITVLELDAAGKITRLTTAYDTLLVTDEQFKSLVLLAAN